MQGSGRDDHSKFFLTTSKSKNQSKNLKLLNSGLETACKKKRTVVRGGENITIAYSCWNVI